MSLLNSVFHSRKNITPADEHPYGGFRLMEDQSSEPLDSVFHCMLKGTIIFAATFGCVHGVLSEFEISYNYVLVCAILYLVSMVLSFMHIRKWIFNVGYPVLFLIFTNALFQNRALANSGFQAFINIFNEAYSKHFHQRIHRNCVQPFSDHHDNGCFCGDIYCHSDQCCHFPRHVFSFGVQLHILAPAAWNLYRAISFPDCALFCVLRFFCDLPFKAKRSLSLYLSGQKEGKAGILSEKPGVLCFL